MTASSQKGVDTVISPAEAVTAAARALKELDLRTNANMAHALAGAHVGPPLFVKRLDVPDRDYYLVPWENEDGITLVMELYASAGSLAGAAPLKKPVRHITLSPKQAIAAVAQSTGREPAGEPQLVWRPCRESPSPMRPFYRIATETGELFVSPEGQVYTTLTPFGRGG